MTNIYTVLALGQTIPAKVLMGLAHQSEIVNLGPVITPHGKHPRQNMISNWIEALGRAGNGTFIGMDSDVVMHDPQTIEKLLEKSADNFLTTIKTQTSQHYKIDGNTQLAHALFACTDPKKLRRALIDKQKNGYTICPICMSIMELRADNKIVILGNPIAHECKREMLTNANDNTVKLGI